MDFLSSLYYDHAALALTVSILLRTGPRLALACCSERKMSDPIRINYWSQYGKCCLNSYPSHDQIGAAVSDIDALRGPLP
jgi:hypothetical protein